MAQVRPPKRSALRFFGQIGLTIALVAAGAVAFRHFLGPRASLQRVLDAETDAMNNLRQKEYLALQDQLDDEWWNMRRSLIEARTAARKEGEAWANTPEPRRTVTNAEVMGPRGWALWEAGVNGVTIRQVDFFVQREGEWRHTRPDPEYWGEPRAAAGEHLRWAYRERDEEWVRPLVDSAEPLYARIRADFGLPGAGQSLTVTVRYDYAGGWAAADRVEVATPLLAGYDPSRAGEYLAVQLAEAQALQAAGGTLEGLPAGPRALLQAVARYEAGRLVPGARPGAGQLGLPDAVAGEQVVGLQQVWPAGEPATPWSLGEAQLRYALAYSLIEFVAERYGAASVPALLGALGGAETIGQALEPVLDVEIGVFEGEWLAFVRERYGAGTQP